MLTGFIIAYIAGTLAIGFWASKRIKTTVDFTLAGRSLSAMVVGVTIFATWFGPELIMGIPGYFAQEGLTAVIPDLFGNSISLLLVGMFYARKMYRLNIVTINDFFRLRFGPGVESMTSLINVFAYFSWIAAQFLALAYLFETILGIPIGQGIALGAAIVLIYTYVGGMWAVSITDMIQTVVIVVGLLFLAVKLLTVTGGITPVLDKLPAGFFSIRPEPGLYNWLDHISLWMVLGVGAIPAQEIYQRVLSARNEKAGQSGAFLSSGMLFVIGSIPLIIALCINYVHPELILENDGQNMIPAMVTKFTSVPMQILFFGALISAILSTSSGAMLAPATVIGENLIKPHVKNITDKQLLAFTRFSVIVVALISGGMAFYNTSIHSLVLDSVTLYLVCLVVPFTVGLYWKRATTRAAWASIASGLGVWLICLFLETRVEPWMIGLLASFIAMIGVSLVTHDSSGISFEQRVS